MGQQRTRSDEVVKNYLFDGVEGVQRLSEERGGISRKVLRVAMRELEQKGRDFSALERWCIEHHDFGLSNRGRAGPVVGETRPYRALKSENGGAFLRVPVGLYGVPKGGTVRIRFDADGPRFLNVAAS